MIELVTIPKNKDHKPRSKKFEKELAEKVLRKSTNWKLADNSKYTYKDGVILEKEKAK